MGEEDPAGSLTARQPDLQGAANQADIIFVKNVSPLLPNIKLTATAQSVSRSPDRNSKDEICRLQNENKIMRTQYDMLVAEELRTRSLMAAEVIYYKNKVEQQAEELRARSLMAAELKYYKNKLEQQITLVNF